MFLYKSILSLLIIGLILPSFCFAQEGTPQMPQDIEEAKSFGFDILKRLPEAIKDVWQNQALPLWQNMWDWVKNFWETYVGDKVGDLWQKFLNLLGKETPDLGEEFQKEKEEMRKDVPEVGRSLWQRFQDLLK